MTDWRFHVGDLIWFAHYDLVSLGQDNIPGKVLEIDPTRGYRIEVWYPAGRHTTRWTEEKWILGTRVEGNENFDYGGYRS